MDNKTNSGKPDLTTNKMTKIPPVTFTPASVPVAPAPLDSGSVLIFSRDVSNITNDGDIQR